MRITSRTWLLSSCLPLLMACNANNGEQPMSPQEARTSLAIAYQEALVVDELIALERRFAPEDMNLVHADLFDVRTGEIVPDQCIAIRNGQISEIAETCGSGPKVTTRNMKGKVLFPGLADMHVHQLTSHSIHILNIVNGVTMVRDMDGFPWILQWRELVNADSAFMPSMYVTGTIISEYSLGGNAIAVGSTEEARKIVRDQVAQGYDAIKVHNNLGVELYDAVIDEARQQEIPVVGHVPHRISLEHVLSSGQLSIEHMKGYVLDQTLQVTNEDYVELTRQYPVWLCPTIYSTRFNLRGKAARDWFDSHEANHVSDLVKDDWRMMIDTPLSEAHQNLRQKTMETVRRVNKVTDRIIAGTDSGGGYSFMVPGFALHDELHLLEEAGLSRMDALRAATFRAAAAAQASGKWGEIVPGARADILVLSGNPRESELPMSGLEDVIVRGRYIPASAREAMLARLADIMSEGFAIRDRIEAAPTRVTDELAEKIEKQHAAGFTHSARMLDDMARAMDVLEGAR